MYKLYILDRFKFKCTVSRTCSDYSKTVLYYIKTHTTTKTYFYIQTKQANKIYIYKNIYKNHTTKKINNIFEIF